MTGACLGLVNIALGLYELITLSLNPRNAINAIYSILFGSLMVICEARWVKVLKHFYFLQLFLGLGAFYIFVGGLALGGAWYQYVVGAVSIGVGLIYFVLGVACRRMGHENFRSLGFRNKSSSAPPPPQQPPAASAAAEQPHAIGGGGSAYENSYSQDGGGGYAEPAAIRAAKQSAYSNDPGMA